MRAFIVALSFLSVSGCTVINTVALPSTPGTKAAEIFVTAGDITEPHDTLGVIQVTRSGPLLLGFIDVVGTDLEAGFRDVLMPKVKEMGGDGVVRARFHMTQYTPWAHVMGAIFFIFPLPSSVTITGQVVKLKAVGASSAPALPIASISAQP